MAISNAIEISQAELLRVAAAAYHGKSIRISLAYDPTNTLTTESTTAAYDALKLSGDGYADITSTLGTGAYDSADGRHEIGTSSGADQYIAATFGPFSAAKTYDTIYYVIDSHTKVYGRRRELPEITVAAGQSTRAYPFQIVVNDAY